MLHCYPYIFVAWDGGSHAHGAERLLWSSLLVNTYFWHD